MSSRLGSCPMLFRDDVLDQGDSARYHLNTSSYELAAAYLADAVQPSCDTASNDPRVW